MGLFSCQKAEDPACRYCLRKNGSCCCSLYAPVQEKNKYRIQNNIEHSTDDDGKHSNSGKALAIDKSIHSNGNHNKDTSQQINTDVLICIGKGHITGSKRIQKRSFHQKSQEYQYNSCCNQKGKRISHNMFCFFIFLSASCNGTKRRSSRSYQKSKCHNHCNDRETDPHASKSRCICTRNPPDIHTVHNIIKYIDKLCCDQRQ